MPARLIWKMQRNKHTSDPVGKRKTVFGWVKIIISVLSVVGSIFHYNSSENCECHAPPYFPWHWRFDFSENERVFRSVERWITQGYAHPWWKVFGKCLENVVFCKTRLTATVFVKSTYQPQIGNLYFLLFFNHLYFNECLESKYSNTLAGIAK